MSATIFLITTADFMVAGLMPSLARAFAVSVDEFGNLVDLCALGVTFGGPLVIVLLLWLGVPNKDALLRLLAVFLIGSRWPAWRRATPRLIPLVLAAYGLATVIGNLVIGRPADRHTIRVLAIGFAILGAALAGFAALPTDAVVSVAAFLVIGLTGVSLNPAMVARVMRVAHPGPMVNSLHASVVTAGLAFGTWLGGVAIDRGYGMTAPLWIGVGLALLGLLSLAPRWARDLTA